MNQEELVAQAERIIKEASAGNTAGGLAQAKQFLSTYGGKDNHFLNQLKDLKLSPNSNGTNITVQSVLRAFCEYVKSGLLRSISLERGIQIDTVSDYLEQAERLLMDSKVHPAAPAVIIGASLEEFLRNWLEEQGTDLTKIKNSIDAYAQRLRELELISKQDGKDIISWGGTRNDAAHGHWNNVEDRNRIKLMLEGVNLFMRQHSS
ncbi:MAG: hypothetical protein IPN44_02120 [Flavobacteriales bacterium]|nr:hypothetical protein [Flavobacteriales bacterium]